MIVKHSERNPERHVKGTGFTSIRLLLECDGLGFSLHETRIEKGGPYHWHYKNHLEACYCIKGAGVLTNLSNGDSFDILPGTLYVLDKNDDHTFEAVRDTILISVFNPPVTGDEVHDEDGSYPANKSIKSTAAELLSAVEESADRYTAIEKIESILVHQNKKIQHA